MSRRDDLYGNEFGDGGMNDPDWDRALVHKGKLSPLGEPRLWGATVTQTIPAGAAGATLTSEQVVQVACSDGYPRAWTLIGTIKQLSTIWAFAKSASIGPTDFWFSQCEVTMGVGQTSIKHVFNLGAIADADAPFYFPVSFTGPTSESRAFIIPGALVGNAISIRVVNTFIFSVALGTAFDMQTSLVVTPFNPGSGL